MQPEIPPPTFKLDPVGLLKHASGPVKLTVGLLLVASTAVWLVALLKAVQIARVRQAEAEFEREALRVDSASDLVNLAAAHREAPGARVVTWLSIRAGRNVGVERLKAIANRALVTERQRVGALLPILGTVGSASPFVGLFGTVYGIIDAFVRIGAEKSASLPVVAPAIGEALMATAIGLVAAIPAVVFYNHFDKRIGDFEAELEASVEEWVQLIAENRPAVVKTASVRPPQRTMGG